MNDMQFMLLNNGFTIAWLSQITESIDTSHNMHVQALDEFEFSNSDPVSLIM